MRNEMKRCSNVFDALLGQATAGLALLVSVHASAQGLQLVRAAEQDTEGYARWVQVVGNHAFVTDGIAGLQVFDVSDPGDPVLAGSYDTSGDAWGVEVVGNLIFVADGSRGLVLIKNLSAEPAAPVISFQPQGRRAPIGAQISFGVDAIGNPPLSYQWRFNGTEIAGATNGMYTIDEVSPEHAGGYSVVVRNGVGSVTSAPAALAVEPDGLRLAAEEARRMANGAFRCTCYGPASAEVAVQYSTDLDGWVDLLEGFMGPDGRWVITDRQTDDQAQRFYRARRVE